MSKLNILAGLQPAYSVAQVQDSPMKAVVAGVNHNVVVFLPNVGIGTRSVVRHFVIIIVLVIFGIMTVLTPALVVGGTASMIPLLVILLVVVMQLVALPVDVVYNLMMLIVLLVRWWKKLGMGSNVFGEDIVPLLMAVNSLTMFFANVLVVPVIVLLEQHVIITMLVPQQGKHILLVVYVLVKKLQIVPLLAARITDV